MIVSCYDGETYMSLFEFKGRPAGKKLAFKIFVEAEAKGIKIKRQDVFSPGYKGVVCLYPVSYLQTLEALRA